LWESPIRAANGPIARRCAEAEGTGFAERRANRRIALRALALSYETYGNCLVLKKLFRWAHAFVGEPYSRSEWADCEALSRS
jgi:hypothetical protein